MRIYMKNIINYQLDAFLLFISKTDINVGPFFMD
jgi:hypothetical protein